MKNQDASPLSRRSRSQAALLTNPAAALRHGLLIATLALLGLAGSVLAETDGRADPALRQALTQEERNWLAQHPRIVVAVNPGWAPIEFLTEGKKFKGAAWDYLNILGKQLGVDFLPESDPSAVGVPDMIAAKSTGKSVAGFSNLPEPYLRVPVAIFVHSDNLSIHGLKDLDGKRVAVFKNGPVGRMLAEKTTAQLFDADIAEEALSALSAGQVDAYVGNELVISYVASTQGYRKIKNAGRTPLDASISMAVRDDSPLLASILQKGLASIPPEEQLRIYNNWHSPENPVSPTTVYTLIASLVLLGVIIVLLRKRLRAEVEARVRSGIIFQERFQTLFEFTPDPLIIINTAGVIQLASHKCQDLLDPKTLIGKPVEQLLPARTSSKYRQALMALLEHLAPGDKTVLRQLSLRDASGRKRHLEVHIAAMQTESELLVAISAQDISLHIAHRHRLAEALSDSEARYLQVVRNISEIVFAVDEDARFRFLNQAWETHTGIAVSAAIGRPVADFVLEEDRGKWRAMLAGRQFPQSAELRFMRAHDAPPLWLMASINRPLHEPGVFSGTLSNIDALKRSNIALQVSEERYALASSATTDGIWDWDLQTNQVFQSSRWKAQLGFADAELESAFATWNDRIHPDDRESAMQAIQACLDGKTPIYEHVHRLRHRDGSWRWFLDRGIVLRNPLGLPYRMAGSHADITPLKNAQDALKEREQELEAIFLISPDGIITITHEGRVSSVNPAFSQITGIDSAQLIGRSEQELEALINAESEQPHHFITGHQERTETRPDHHPEETVRLSLLRPRFVVIACTVRKLSNQAIAKIVYFRDITKETEVDRMKSEFLATAAHELRTPMCSVLGFSELLVTRHFNDEERVDIARTINQQAASLVNMLNELLDLARIEARAGRDFHFAPVDLEVLVTRALGELMMPGDQRQVTLIKGNANLPARVYGDDEKLRQVLTNVLSNAYKYSPGGGAIELSLIEEQPQPEGPSMLGIRVKDHGIGMSPQQLEHLFERFWRADTSGKIPGSGLGMSLVEQTIQIHQGRVEVSSALGQGTSVTIWLARHQ